MITIEQLNRIPLGIQGENNANAFSVDVSEWLSEFPNGSISVKVLRPTESVPYLAAVTVDDSALNWVITASDTGIAGEGQAEIQLTDDDVVKKARVVPTVVLPCLDGTAEPTPPPAAQPWIDQVAGYRDEVIAAKEEIEAQNYVKSVNGIEAGENGNAKVTAFDIDYTPTQKVGDAIADATYKSEQASAQADIVGYNLGVVEAKIPDEASATNKLADKAFVGDSINSVTAYYITKNADGDQFATKAELDSATEFYSGGQIRLPVTRNDYCIVLADETHDNATTRYIFNNDWEYQYTVNETALTEEQMTAINSGISAQKVAKYDGYDNGKQDTLTDAQLSAMNSGITADKVAKYDGQTTQVVYYFRSDKTHLYKDANLTAQATFSEVKANLDDRTKFVYVEDLNANDYHECLIPTHLSDSIIYFVRTTLTASGDFKICKLQLNANGTVVETEQTAQQKLTAGDNITIDGNVISASGGEEWDTIHAVLQENGNWLVTKNNGTPYEVAAKGERKGFELNVGYDMEKEITMAAIIPAVSTNASIQAQFISNGSIISPSIISNGFNTAGSKIQYYLFNRGGMWFSVGARCALTQTITNGNATSGNVNMHPVFYTVGDKIPSITFWASSSSIITPVGTEYTFKVRK